MIVELSIQAFYEQDQARFMLRNFNNCLFAKEKIELVSEKVQVK